MVVEKSIKGLANSQLALTVTVDAASVEDAYQAKLKKYQANLQLDGFRKGKAPVSIVERKYGDAIREESTFECLEENLKQAIDTLEDKDKPLAYSTPVLQDEEKLIPFKKGEGITFTVHYDVYPAIEVKDYKAREVEVTKVEISDSDVNDEIEKLRDQNAIVKTKDGAIEKGDIVTLDYAELDEEGNPIADTERKNFTFTLGTGYNYYRIDDDLVGLKKGDEKVIEKKYADDDVTFHGEKKNIKVKVDEVKFRELPEVDADFCQDVKEEYKSVDDLKKGLREKLEKEVDEALKNDKINALLALLVEETKFDVPASMVDVELDHSWRNFVQQSGLEESKLLQFFSMQNQTKDGIMAEWRPAAEKNLREQLILEEIKKKEDFKVDEEEFKKTCDEQLKNITDEKSKEYYENMIKDDMQFKMVVPFLLENNTFKTKETKSYKEFMNR